MERPLRDGFTQSNKHGTVKSMFFAGVNNLVYLRLYVAIKYRRLIVIGLHIDSFFN